MEYKGWGLAANADFKLNDDLKLQSITAYRKFDTGFSPDGDLSPANVGFGISQLDSWFVSQELRLNARLGDLADLTVGGFISDEKTTYYTLQDIRYVAIPACRPARCRCSRCSSSATIRCARSPRPCSPLRSSIRPPRLRSRLVVAYTNESKAYTFNRFNLDGKTINGFLDPVGAANGAGYSGPERYSADGQHGPIQRQSLRLPRQRRPNRFSPAVLAYATVSTGFKGGGIAPRPFNAAQAVPFGPETLTAFELGLKTDLFDRRVRFNVSAYYNKFKGAQLTLLSCPQFGGPGPCAVPQNAGDADVKGVEAELFIQPVQGLQIDASASVLDWDWKCVVPAVVNPAGATSGCSTDPALVSQLVSPPRGVSKAQWSAGIQYEADLGSAGSITPRFDAAYQGAIAGTATIAPKGSPSDLFATADAFTIANARLTWRNAERDLDVSFEVTNIFDKYYFLSKFDLTGAGAGSISGMPAVVRANGR